MSNTKAKLQIYFQVKVPYLKTQLARPQAVRLISLKYHHGTQLPIENSANSSKLEKSTLVQQQMRNNRSTFSHFYFFSTLSRNKKNPDRNLHLLKGGWGEGLMLISLMTFSHI